MFRAEAWCTAALLAIGSIGSLVYNWPANTTDQVPSTALSDDQTPAAGEDLSRGLSLTGEALANEPRSFQEGTTAQNVPVGQDAANSQVIETQETGAAISGGVAVQLDPLELGDRFLLGGNFMGAYQLYLKIQKQMHGVPNDELLIRLGVASEFAGFQDQAEQYYRDAIQSPTARSLHKIWGLIGTARIWESQGRLDEASNLLSELLLTYGSGNYPAEVRMPIHGHLADCLQKQFLSRATPGELGLPRELAQTVEYSWMETRLGPIVSSMLQVPEAEDPGQVGQHLQVIQNPVQDISLILIDVDLPFQPLSQLFDDLAKATGVHFEISLHARSAMSGRSVRAFGKAMPVSILLDQSLGPLTVVWQQRDGIVHIAHERELDVAQQHEFSLDRIQRLLRHLQLNFPNGVERVAALMHEGNNSLLQRNFEIAADKYRSARELEPAGELSARLFFNQSTLEYAEGERETALENTYRALDQSLAPRIRTAAYARIAKLELELGRPERAIPAASRGLKLASTETSAADNLLVLAKSYFLDDDPFSANRILFQNSKTLTEASRKRLAGFIAAYARFQVVRPLDGLQNEGERLVLSLAALQPEDPEDFVDHLIISRAFYDVGFRTKAIEHLTHASNGASMGYWQDRTRLELAQHLCDLGELENARATLESLLAPTDTNLQAEKQLLIAKIALDQEETATCFDLARNLLTQPLDLQQKKRALELLGKAYQMKGKHYSAALCFAGLLPEEAAPESPATNPSY